MSRIERVLVAGAGAMGAQIAMVCALSGCTVSLYDIDATVLEKAMEQLRTRMDAQVAKGRREVGDVEAAFARLATTTELAGDVDLVIEAIVEKLGPKRDFFAQVDRLVGPATILASNSSGFIPSVMASATNRPERFVNLHFFNPALVMACVEIVRGPETSDATMTVAEEFVAGIGKQAVVLEKEIPGFVANRILNAVRDEAIRLLEGGYADIDAIDLACRTALGYPMGPFELMDLTGIDIGFHTKNARFEETGDPADKPSATVAGMVERGTLGRKTGRGFYIYDNAGNRVGKGI